MGGLRRNAHPINKRSVGGAVIHDDKLPTLGLNAGMTSRYVAILRKHHRVGRVTADVHLRALQLEHLPRVDPDGAHQARTTSNADRRAYHTGRPGEGVGSSFGNRWKRGLLRLFKGLYVRLRLGFGDVHPDSLKKATQVALLIRPNNPIAYPSNNGKPDESRNKVAQRVRRGWRRGCGGNARRRGCWGRRGSRSGRQGNAVSVRPSDGDRWPMIALCRRVGWQRLGLADGRVVVVFYRNGKGHPHRHICELSNPFIGSLQEPARL